MEITVELINPNETVYVTSDLHINHRKLCSGYEEHFDETRKYVTIEEMNDDIITQWNNTVTNDDIVIFLGDVMLSTPMSTAVDVFKEYYNKLNFKHLYLVMGNHDHKLFKKIEQRINEFPNITLVYSHMIVVKDNKTYFLQHYDFSNTVFGMSEMLKRTAENRIIDILVHGHTHSHNKISSTYWQGTRYQLQNCVCWDAWYRPVNLNELQSTKIRIKE